MQPKNTETLAEVRNRVLDDYRHEKALDLAKTRAEELAKRVKSGENFATAPKALGFEVKTSEQVSRAGSLPEAGSMKQFAAAFNFPFVQYGHPVSLGTNW